MAPAERPPWRHHHAPRRGKRGLPQDARRHPGSPPVGASGDVLPGQGRGRGHLPGGALAGCAAGSPGPRHPRRVGLRTRRPVAPVDARARRGRGEDLPSAPRAPHRPLPAEPPEDPGRGRSGGVPRGDQHRRRVRPGRTRARPGLGRRAGVDGPRGRAPRHAGCLARGPAARGAAAACARSGAGPPLGGRRRPAAAQGLPALLRRGTLRDPGRPLLLPARPEVHPLHHRRCSTGSEGDPAAGRAERRPAGPGGHHPALPEPDRGGGGDPGVDPVHPPREGRGGGRREGAGGELQPRPLLPRQPRVPGGDRRRGDRGAPRGAGSRSGPCWRGRCCRRSWRGGDSAGRILDAIGSAVARLTEKVARLLSGR